MNHLCTPLPYFLVFWLISLSPLPTLALHIHPPVESQRRQISASQVVEYLREHLDDMALGTFAIALTAAATRFPVLGAAFEVLGAGNKTFFLSQLGPSDVEQLGDFWENPSLIGHTLLYHIVYGRYDEDYAWAHHPQRTLLTTALQDDQRLEANGSQPLVVTTASVGGETDLYVYNQGHPLKITAMQYVPRLDLNLALVERFFTLPPSITNIFASLSTELSQFGYMLNKTGRINVLEQQRGVTIFAPNTSVFYEHTDFFRLATDEQLLAIARNHIVKGKSIYSNSFLNSLTLDATSGHTIELVTDDTGGTGTGLAVILEGSIRASVLQSDILMENGVLHIIDGINMDTVSRADDDVEPDISAIGGGYGAVGSLVLLAVVQILMMC
ncbi:hypothetical protein AX16_004890 [Volvariella volvacea WC 439]|nr:hypothetical protein AX16_004890 [Volvariella volvacea WC 439]